MSKIYVLVGVILSELADGLRASKNDMEQQLTQFHEAKADAASGDLAGDHFEGVPLPLFIRHILSFAPGPSNRGLSEDGVGESTMEGPQHLDGQEEVASEMITPEVIALKNRLDSNREELARLDASIRASLLKSLRLESRFADVQKKTERLAGAAKTLQDQILESSEALERASEENPSDLNVDEERASEKNPGEEHEKASGIDAGLDVQDQTKDQADKHTFGADEEKTFSREKHSLLIGALSDLGKRLQSNRRELVRLESLIDRSMRITFDLKLRRASAKREFDQLAQAAETLHLQVPMPDDASKYALEDDEIKMIVLAMRGTLDATRSDMEDDGEGGERDDEEDGLQLELDEKEHVTPPFVVKFNDALQALRSWKQAFFD